MKIYLAIDLGAESGRIVAAGIDGSSLLIEELHRFTHAPLRLPSGWHWNVSGIWSEIIGGLRKASAWSREHGHEIISCGVDCWGIDWALLGEGSELLALPHAYRDPRNVHYCGEAQELLGVSELYQVTGIQMMPINTLYSLYAMHRTSPTVIANARRFLFLPDLFHFWLSGVVAVERTIASTSQMLDISTGKWSSRILERLGIPQEMLGEIVEPGTRLGPVRSEVALETGLPPTTEVITPGSHDTASAIVAIPAKSGSRWCYLSSGTWSLLGAELPEPRVNEPAEKYMFTNEGGVGGTTRLLKNIAGMWLVQQCRAEWAREGTMTSYEELFRMAADAIPFRTIINPNDETFHAPVDMRGAIGDYAIRTNQPVPESLAEFVRCAIDSLALAYNATLGMLEETCGQSFDILHIVGGGSKNSLLNQLTADLTGRTVIPGPVEATAIGNGLLQAMSCGALSSLEEIRSLVRHSGLVEQEVVPGTIGDVADRISLFQRLISRS